jgi:DNA-binding CsgD family transcriptional regulator
MLEALMDDLKAVETLPGLEGAIRKHLEQLGFDRFAYLALRLPHSTKAPYVVTTYPESWALHYHNQDYVNHDPVLLRATRTMQAFDWPTLSADPSLSPTQQRVLKEARDFDIAKGATVPVHAPGGGFATLSVASTAMSEAEFQREWKRLWPHVHLTALYSQSAVENRLLDTDQYQAFFLTERERECLLWTARGKTAGETSTILAISSETVVFHLKNAMRKIGVYSKHHAVVKAIMMGLIHP